MSAGLMSCVRENSPPLEMARSDGRTQSFSSSTHEPQKRRRFHPLRNLRRIFRRRSVAHADTVTPTPTLTTGTTSSPSSTTSAAHSPHYYLNATSNQQYNYPDDCDITSYDDTTTRTVIYSPANLIDINKCNSGGSDGLIKLHDNQQIYTRDYYIKGDKREHSANSVRKKEMIDDLEHAVAGCDMTDCQRSLSEGRLVDSDLSRDAFSQSHDSVFSESATASSLSIVLKAELVDALRKRRNRPNAFDEDLGLPHSPTILHNISKNNMLQHINQSDKSLSFLSITSSDFDDESMLNISDFSLQNKMSIDTSRTSSDSTDGSIGSKLSHSAARHKMAIRPKKKGPSRHRPIEQKPLPSTPEVTEEVNRVSTPTSRSNALNATKPPIQTISKSVSTTVPSKSVDHYINTTLECSKITEDTTPVSPSSVTILSTANCNLVTSNSENDSKKLITKLQMNNNVSHEDAGDTLDKGGIEKPSSDSLSKQLSVEKKINVTETVTNTLSKEYDNKVIDKILIETKPYESRKFIKEVRTGPASRQRLLPLDKNYSPELKKKVIETDSIVNISSLSPVLIRKHQKISRSEEILIPKNVNNKELLSEFPRSVSPPKSNWHGQQQAVIREESSSSFEQQKLHLPKIYGLNSPTQNVMTTPTFTKNFTTSNNSLPTSPITHDNYNIKTFNNKSVEKSKSFRSTNYTNTDNNINKSIHLPSLPDLTNNNNNNINNNNINTINKINNNEQNLLKLKFEINDNNLVNKYQKVTDNNNDNNIKRNIFTTNEYTPIGKINKLPHLNMGGSVDNSNINNNNNTNNNTNNNNMNIKNITDIEEKIDILVKSSFTTTLKKKEDNIDDLKNNNNNNNNNNNVSITAIIPTMTNSITTPVSITPVITTSVITTNDYDKKSPIIQHDSKKIPEFMKFNLNRADTIPPIKSNIITTINNNNSNNLLQNIKNNNITNSNNNNNEIIKTRRFSNENIEINETKQQLITPTTPIESHDNNLKRNNLNHQQQSSPFKNKTFNNNNNNNNDNNKLINDYRKMVADEKLKIERRLSTTIASSTAIPMTIALITTTTATVTTTVTTGSTFITTSTHADILNNNNNCCNKTVPIVDDENSVVLRKKSFTPSTKKDDQPELMKVFARRSLKIKDSDSIQDDLINAINSNNNNNNNNNIKAINNMDSDKENQSSSEEKLDKITKNENNNNNKIIIIDNEINDKYLHQEKQLLQQQHQHQQHINVPTSIIGVTTTPIKKFINTNIITPKPFVAPSRFGNVSNFRNVSAVQSTIPITTITTTASVITATTPTTPTTPPTPTVPTTFLDIKKNLYTNPMTQPIGIASLITNNNNNNNFINETNTIIVSTTPIAKQQINKSTTTTAANNLINSRHTINVPTQFIVNPIIKNERPVTMSATTTSTLPTGNILSARTNDKQEFKGILQRRAEWEKRAKETFK